ncbi:MAG TPA: hypothetical protein VHG53_06065 [Candidatus Limnocylindria bacterium]|nr:hypothetical protein [Candidatus Limnocylindria bacterium]
MAAIAPARLRAEPVTLSRPTSVLRQAVRVRDGWRERDALCEIDPARLRLTDARGSRSVAWPDLRAISVEGDHVRIITPAAVLVLVPALDRVGEPALAPPFAHVLEQARAGTLDPSTGALHDLANTIDRAQDAFAEADDPVVPVAVGVCTALVGLILVASIPIVLQLVARVAPAPGAFVIQPRIAPYDPRTLIAAFAGAAALAAAVARIGLGEPARIWARGTLRGWHRNAPGPAAPARRAIARLVLEPRVAALVGVIALALLLPSAFMRTTVDAAGIHSASGLPVLSRDHAWADVTDVVPLSVGVTERSEGFAVMLVFSDGSRLSTRGRDLFGGSERMFFDFARVRAP